MTETPNAATASRPAPSPPPTAQAPRPPLRRVRDDRVLGGVCGGLARYLGIDPVLVRVIVVVLAIFGGGGLLLYVAAWLLIPEDGRDESVAQQFIGGQKSPTAAVVTVGVVLGTLLVISAADAWFPGSWLGAPGLLLLIGAVALGVWLMRREQPAAPSLNDSPISEAPTVSNTLTSLPPTEDRQPKPRSVLGLLTVSCSALVAGVLIAIALLTDASGIDAVTVLGATLSVVALGLLVGSVVGRSRGLIWLGVLLALATATSAAVSSIDLRGGVGERNWQPTTAVEATTDFRLGLGEATLDLRALEIPPGGLNEPITAEVGMGQLTVLLPDEVDLEVLTEVGLGNVRIVGAESPGTTDAQETLTTVDVPNEIGSVSLDLEVGVGEIALRSTDPQTIDRLQQGVTQ